MIDLSESHSRPPLGTDPDEPEPIPCPGGCGGVWRAVYLRPSLYRPRARWLPIKSPGMCPDCRAREATPKPAVWPPEAPPAWDCAGGCGAHLPFHWRDGPWYGPESRRGRWVAPDAAVCAPCAVAAEEARRQSLRLERRRLSGLPERLAGYTFGRFAELTRDGEFVPATSRDTVTEAEFSTFCASLESGQLGITPWNRPVALRLRRMVTGGDLESVILTGHVGSGKSTLLAATLGDLADTGVDVAYMAEAELIDRLRTEARSHRRGDGRGLVYRLAQVPVLALDDLGTVEVPKVWFVDAVEQLIAQRYDARRPVLISTNRASFEEITALYGERVASRLHQMAGGIVIPLDGPDWRTGQMRNPHPDEE